MDKWNQESRYNWSSLAQRLTTAMQSGDQMAARVHRKLDDMLFDETLVRDFRTAALSIRLSCMTPPKESHVGDYLEPGCGYKSHKRDKTVRNIDEAYGALRSAQWAI